MQEATNIDILKLYFGDPYPITDKITIYQPTIQDIIDYGENAFFAMLYVFIGNTTYRRLELWENGCDWNKITDYELFCRLVSLLPPEQTGILFGDLDFTKFKLMPTGVEIDEPEPEGKQTATEKRKRYFRLFEASVTFKDEEHDIEINAETYHHLVDVLREMVNIFPKTEYTVGKTSKEIIIEEERTKLAKFTSENDGRSSSILQPWISSCVNHPGFKYRKDELRKIQINEFMDSVKRLQVYESTHALLGGAYSGFMDSSKIPNENFDFMRKI